MQAVQGKVLRGQGISPGQEMGRAFVHEDILHQDSESIGIARRDIEDEQARMSRAVQAVLEDLARSADRVTRELNDELGAVFLAQRAILEQPDLQEELREEIAKELVVAEEAAKRVFHRWERHLRRQTTTLPGSPDHDMADVGRRILHELRGLRAHALPDMPRGSVLVASRLLPSDTLWLSREAVSAVAVEFAGPGSHVALMTRELGVPAVAQVPELLEGVSTNDVLLVDGNSGTVVVDPDEKTKTEFQRESRRRAVVWKRAHEQCHLPAVTEDGIRVEVAANVGCREDAELAKRNGADGVGLFRLENLLMSHRAFPSERKLLDELRESLHPLRDETVVLRLLDAGGDKRFAPMEQSPESNPFLGQRGIRLLLEQPDLLKAQLRAFLRLGGEQDIRILVPMVTLDEEMVRVREIVEEVAAEIGITARPPLGAMIETPAAALCADSLAEHADFFSFGTNDLTQYTMAADRENPHVAHCYQDRHPAVLRLMEYACRSAGDTPVAICGELASRTESLTALLDLGIRSLSVAPPRIPQVKEAIRNRGVSS